MLQLILHVLIEDCLRGDLTSGKVSRIRENYVDEMLVDKERQPFNVGLP